MASPSVLITDSDIPGKMAEQTLQNAGFRVVLSPSPSPADIIASAEDVESLVVQWASITAEILDELPRLKFISRLGIGYDMIDISAATERGIAVANTPSYCIEEVAAHTIAMVMSWARGLPTYNRAVRSGAWMPLNGGPMVVRPSKTTVAVIGFGRIGSQVARALRALGFRVLVNDPFAPESAIVDAGCIVEELNQSLIDADIVCLHVPLDNNTRHMIDAKAIQTMKKGAVVVNTCRGALIDEQALADALRSGQLGAAALDVFEEEPLPPDSPLLALDNVLLSPHAAWYSPEALLDLPVHAAQNVVDFFANGPSSVPIVNPDYRHNSTHPSTTI